MLPPLIRWVSLLHLTTGRRFLQENVVPVKERKSIFCFYGDGRIDLYNTNMIVYYIQEKGGSASSEHYIIHSQLVRVRSYKSVKAHEERSSQQVRGGLRRW